MAKTKLEKLAAEVERLAALNRNVTIRPWTFRMWADTLKKAVDERERLKLRELGARLKTELALRGDVGKM